jgi:hypothetical protein
VLGLSIALVVSFLTAVGCTVASIMIYERKPLPSSIPFCSVTALLLAAVGYDLGLNLCYLTKSAKPFIVLWATPVRSP